MEFSGKTVWMAPPQNERNEKTESNEWFMFRNRINVSGTFNGLLRIAADSKYWIYINGEIVVREGGLKRGPVPDGSYYDEVDASGFLREGENTIAVLLWYFGRQSFSHRDSGVPGLLVDALGVEFGCWKVKKHPSYFDAGYIQDSYRLPENSIGFDARYDIPEWINTDFDDAGWAVAVESGDPGKAPWGSLEKREFKQWFWSDLKEFESVEKLPPLGDGFTVYRCKLPYNMHFVPAIEVDENCRAGSRIAISVGHDTNCLSPVFIIGNGARRYESIGWMNGEDVFFKVSGIHGNVKKFYYRETSFPSKFSGAFCCDAPLLNRLWEKARRTLLVNMRDTFMDCPCRERAQWPGDLIVQLGQVPYCLDREAVLLVKKGIRENLRWQRDDGIIYGPVPEGNWQMELPSQMLSVISPYGIWTYYMNTADRVTLEELYPFAKRYLNIWEFQKNGLIKYRPEITGEKPVSNNKDEFGTWDWIDWGKRIDSEPALNAWFVLAAQGVRRMAEILGYDADAKETEQKETQVRDAFRKFYWNRSRNGYVSENFEFDPDDRVQALAILCGAAESDQYPQLKKIFETVEQACPYMEKYVLEALFKMGESELALSRMSKRYRSMVENDNTTLWEHWPEESVHAGTINHAWSGGPLTMMSQKVAGLQPLSPGWSRFSVCPQPGKLKQFSASLCSPRGVIAVNARKTESEWIVEVTVPKGTVAVIDFSGLGSSQLPCELTSGKQKLIVII